MTDASILDSLPLQTVQMRIHSIEALKGAAETAGLNFHLVHVTGKKSKAALLDAIAKTLHFPAHFGGNLDALYDCLNDLTGGQVIVLEALASDHSTEAVLDVFKHAVKDFAQRNLSFRVFYHCVDTD